MFWFFTLTVSLNFWSEIRILSSCSTFLKGCFTLTVGISFLTTANTYVSTNAWSVTGNTRMPLVAGQMLHTEKQNCNIFNFHESSKFSYSSLVQYWKQYVMDNTFCSVSVYNSCIYVTNWPNKMFDNTHGAESTKYYHAVQQVYLFHRYWEIICYGKYYNECEMIRAEESVAPFNILFQH